MKKNWKSVFLVLAVLAAAGAGVWLVVSVAGDDEAEAPKGQKLISKGKTPAKKVDKHTAARRSNGKKVVTATPVRVPPPKFDIGLEEQKLTEAQRKLLAEIRDALRREDRKAIVSFIRRIQSMKEWPDGIPKAIKKASLEALEWVGGGGCLSEIVGFLGDADPEIVAQAVDIWEDVIAECDHDVDKDGEAGLATNIKNAAKVITDSDAMESVLSEITSGCRHSVAVGVIVEILNSGSDLAKSKIGQVIEDLTGSDEIKTEEQLNAWLKENPDDSDDNIMYGGEESSDDE